VFSNMRVTDGCLHSEIEVSNYSRHVLYLIGIEQLSNISMSYLYNTSLNVVNLVM